MIVVAAVRFESQDEVQIDAGMEELDSLDGLDLELGRIQYRASEVQLTTDLGASVECWQPMQSRSAADQTRIEDAIFREKWSRDHVIRQGPCDDRTNCYGWIFTGGRLWIPGSAVVRILKDNDYREVKEPAVGDLVAYRKDEAIVHVAIVRYLSANRPPLVEGKWGANGAFLHAVDRSMYGGHFMYLHSPRTGHLLSGLHPAEPAPLVEERTE